MRPGLFLLALLAAVPARAAEPSLIGTWQITDAVRAPWVDVQSPAESAEIARLRGLPVSFGPGAIEAGGTVIGCTGAGYEATRFPPEALFQGSLPGGRQAEAAAALGLPAGEVPGIDVACSTGLFSYHFRDGDTVLFALDNVIYTLRRR